MRDLARSLILAALITHASAHGAAATDVTAAAAPIHTATLVLDPHVDVPAPYDWHDAVKPTVANDQASLELIEKGGVDAVVFAVFVPQSARTDEGLQKAQRAAKAKLAAIREIAEQNPGRAEIALTASDVTRIAASHKVAVLISILNAYPLGRDASALAGYYGQGVRILGLTHAGNNDFADSSRPTSTDTPNEHGGLSAAGRALVAEANRLGILIDVSQLTTAAFDQVLALSTAPVIATHSGVRAKSDVPRNLGDAELDALARNGGVIGIVAFSAYLKPTPAEVQKQILAIRTRYGAVNGYEGLTPAQRTALQREIATVSPPATVADLVDSIDYAVKRIGIDHVAISSDFNHGGGVVGWNNEGEAGGVTTELVRRGYSRDDIQKLWSGNVLRVLESAQSATRD